jgi:hypothetical protein
MGQRSQVFVYCINPVNGLKEQFKSLKKYNGEKNELEQLKLKIEKYEKAFGTKQHCIIAYHHQWLYGRSSLIGISNLIEFNQHCDKESNPFKTQTEITGDEYLNLLTNLLGLFKTKLAKVIGRYGYENFQILNFQEPNMRNDITLGDNNDGVFIVNCINDSYSFVNIGGDSTISQLSTMIPFSAYEYVKLYYPEQNSDSKTANIPESTVEKEEYFKSNRKMNRLFVNPFNNYRVMAKNELKKLFPASYRTNEVELNPDRSDKNDL